MTSHTGIKPFQCPICLKFYRRKGILEGSTQLDQHIMSHLTNSCSDATTGDSTSQYSFSEGNKNEDTFTMLQKDMSNKEETLFHFDMKDEEDLDKSLLME